MQENFHLRPLQPGDLLAMHALDLLCFAEPFRFSLRDMQRFATAPAANTVLATAQPEVNATADAQPLLGFVITELTRTRLGIRRAYVVTLDVHPDHRRRGLATALMDEAEAAVALAGARHIDLHVFTGNAAAIRFYADRGYTQTGNRPRFYGPRLDAYTYRKPLTTIAAKEKPR